MMEVTKQYLSEYKRVKAELANTKDRLELYGVGGRPVYDGMPRGSGVSDPTASQAVIKNELEKEMAGLTEQEMRMREEILRAFGEKIIYSMDRQVMMLRYIDNLEWPEVAHIMFSKKQDYIERQDKYIKKVYNLHSRALNALKGQA